MPVKDKHSSLFKKFMNYINMYVKSFIILVPGVNVLKLFSQSLMAKLNKLEFLYLASPS
jgi:hypothetical protein